MAEHVHWGVKVPQFFIDGDNPPPGYDVLRLTRELEAAQLAFNAAGGGAAGGAAAGALPAALPRGRFFLPRDVLAVILAIP